MADELFILFPVFFLLALMYSMAGFGGGSSYLAVLALFSFEYSLIKTTALLCNITVVSGGAYRFYRKGFVRFNKIFPLILFSIPFAYLGGMMQLEEKTFFILLGISLLLASFLMLTQDKMTQNIKPTSNSYNSILGGSIGFLSGMVGIGGGIFLAPVLYLSNWAEAKAIAATASCFILVNSIAGILGQASAGNFNFSGGEVLLLLLAVGMGGFFGSRLSIHQLQSQQIKMLTAILIAVVAIRILIKYI